jgi:hypothetical protein
VLTPEPDKLLKRLYRLHRRVFDQGAGMPAINRFVSPTKPKAVRVWHNANAISTDGMPISEDGACGSIGVGDQSVPVNCQYAASCLVNAAVSGFALALVVVDTSFPKGVKLAQVADFAAMVGLADIDLDADIADAPSILRLFAASPDDPPPGLTTWTRLSSVHSITWIRAPELSARRSR